MDLLYTAHVPPGDGPFPTILALHGWGASAHDLIGLAPILHGGMALVLSPQGPVAFEIGQGMLGFGWFPLRESREVDPGEFQRGADAVRGFLDAAVERYPVDRRKIVPLGFSQGGVMAYDLVLRDPGRFAGLVALSSWLPEMVDRGIPESDALQNFPVLVMHGTEDPMIPVARAQESRDLLIKRGLDVTYREYEMGHEIRPEALRDLVEWLESKAISPIQLA
ncbi:MAG: dienelactone hydrolase family protein [Myxococcota bacterium]|nr:dienelactone hydrolase family protein [Myxococcota bacterium]